LEPAENAYKKKEEELGHENMRLIERRVMLLVIDRLWMEHLTMMEHTRQGIGLQAVGHSDPLIAYKREGHALFQGLLANIQHDLVHTIYHVDMKKRESSPQAAASRPHGAPVDQNADSARNC